MKRLRTILILLLSLIFLCSCTAISAYTENSSAEQTDVIKVYLDGEEIVFDVAPEIEDDRVLVPMRAVFEAFGAKVKWDGETKTVTSKKKSKTIELTIDSKEIKKNDETYESDVAPKIKDGRTLIPLRAVSELLGLDVSWDNDTRTVNITSDKEEDESWKENTGAINLDNLSVSGDGLSADGKVITVSKGGDYTVTGEAGDAQIVVDTEDKVKLRLSGMSLKNESGSAIFIKNADKAYITLTEDTENYLEDAAVYEGADEKEKGALTARDSLEIKGKGTLYVKGNTGHGIFASDSLEIENGNIKIDAENDGVHVNDTFKMTGGSLKIEAGGDGIASDEIVDILDGTIEITTTGDVPAGTNERGFGRMQTAEQETEEEDSVSSKGIKAGWMLDISGGSIDITSTDHAIHCTSDINISGGDINISSGNKGISAHENITIDGGNFNIPKATEGIESKAIMTINDGSFYIIASDDGLNAGGGDGFGGMPFGEGFPQMQDGEFPQMPQDGQFPGMQNGEFPQRQRGGRGDMTVPDMTSEATLQAENGMRGERDRGTPPEMDGGNGEFQQRQRGNGREMTPPDMTSEATPQTGNGMRGGRDDMMMPPEANGENGGNQRMPMGGMGFGGNSTEISTEHHIEINGGTFYINAVNDGIDANGSLVIEGGDIVIEGRANITPGEMGLDTDKALIIRGGTVLAAGSTISEAGAEQNTAVIYLSEAVAAGSEFKINDKSGNTVASIDKTQKQFSQILCSSSELREGEEYEITVNGTVTDTFTVSGSVTTVGEVQMGSFGMGRGEMR
ncbi:MAG: carbohydrate-binding domain-containing protein [Clostridia bacterium]|nr:carbohydrate-binding domain-containing protein [Clostridia bacterium]